MKITAQRWSNDTELSLKVIESGYSRGDTSRVIFSVWLRLGLILAGRVARACQSIGIGERAPVDPSDLGLLSAKRSSKRINLGFNLGRANAARISGIALHTKRVPDVHITLYAVMWITFRKLLWRIFVGIVLYLELSQSFALSPE